MEAKKHTPPPWKVSDRTTTEGQSVILFDGLDQGPGPANGTAIAYVQKAEDAISIIHAYNNIERVTAERDSLLEVLRLAISQNVKPTALSREGWIFPEWVIKARDLVAIVEGGDK